MWNNIRIILLTLNPRKYVGIVKKVLYMHLTACEKITKEAQIDFIYCFLIVVFI